MERIPRVKRGLTVYISSNCRNFALLKPVKNGLLWKYNIWLSQNILRFSMNVIRKIYYKNSKTNRIRMSYRKHVMRTYENTFWVFFFLSSSLQNLLIQSQLKFSLYIIIKKKKKKKLLPFRFFKISKKNFKRWMKKKKQSNCS